MANSVAPVGRTKKFFRQCVAHIRSMQEEGKGAGGGKGGKRGGEAHPAPRPEARGGESPPPEIRPASSAIRLVAVVVRHLSLAVAVVVELVVVYCMIVVLA